jgi:uncharacterized protein YkwD
MQRFFRFVLITSSLLTLACFGAIYFLPTTIQSVYAFLDPAAAAVIIDPATSSQVMPTRVGNSGWFDPQIETEIIKLVNDERKKNNLLPFVPDESLAKIARQRAVEISVSFNHNGITNLCPKCGENIAWGGERTTAPSVVKAWMESESHRRNVLFQYYFRVGVGAYHIGGRIYFALEIKQEVR